MKFGYLKTAILMTLLFSVLLVIGGMIGGVIGLTIGFIFAIIMNFSMYFWSHKLVLRMYNAQEAPKEEFPRLHEMVEDISQRAGLPMPKVYIVPGDHCNAFCTGPNPKKTVIACTKGILDLLSEAELRGVLAHELAHAKNRDMLISTITATIAGVISYISMMARWGAIFGGFGGRDENSEGILEMLVLAIIAPFMAIIIQFAISRSREYEADATGARFINDGEGLASALEKIEKSINYNPLRPTGVTEATSHLFISNPFRGTGLLKLFSTHPLTKDRVERLRKMTF